MEILGEAMIRSVAFSTRSLPMRGKSPPAQLSGVLFLLFFFSPLVSAGQDARQQPAPDKLGVVSFPTSCKAEVQKEFERGVALLHSFTYSAAEAAFRNVAENDPNCAMAHWGIAMTYFHQLWDPPILPASLVQGREQTRQAQRIAGVSDRERKFIHALAIFYAPDFSAIPYQERVSRYETAMGELAAAYPKDTESQVFYALALLASASPFDKTHAKQKHAVAILEPLYRRYPQHPGIAHYLIHACDNQEMAARGLAPARAYSKIAPSAPHALHMPSHIFTRLGMWSDSIASNRAARAAAHNQGDIGEELHAMDYLVYAYLQQGLDRQANEIIGQLKAMPNLDEADPKVAYASTAMPVRYALERRQWSKAATVVPPREAPPQVIAIAVWARAVGLAKNGHPAEARRETERLRSLEQQLRASQAQYHDYWARQVEVQEREAMAWSAQTEGKANEARLLLRKAADEEDSMEKLPVTPGPILPAREQLGDLLLQQNQPALALKEFQLALASAPHRRASLAGLAQASQAVRKAASRNSSAPLPRVPARVAGPHRFGMATNNRWSNRLLA